MANVSYSTRLEYDLYRSFPWLESKPLMTVYIMIRLDFEFALKFLILKIIAYWKFNFEDAIFISSSHIPYND